MLLSTDSLLTAPDLCWTGPFLYQSAIRLEKTSILILALGPPATTEIAVWIGRCMGAPGHGRGRMGAKRTAGAHPAGAEALGGRMRAGLIGTVLSWGRAECGGLSCHSAAPIPKPLYSVLQGFPCSRIWLCCCREQNLLPLR